jgi:hypothetical protein
MIWLCLTPAVVHAKQFDSGDDGSVASLARHWAGTNPDRLSVQSTDYGGLVKDGPMVLYQPKIKNPDGTLPPPFMVSPLLKSILDKVFSAMGPDGGYPTIAQLIQSAVQSAVSASQIALDPSKVPPAAQAAQAAAGQQAGDSAGGAAKDNAAGAIDFCSRFMQNFANDGGSRWNKIRDSVFMPIAILLLLPGAVLAQVKAIASAGNPVLGNVNPFDGILRSIVAIFLIPGTYLVISFGIDFSNCITFTISDQYTRMFGSNMYKDALCGQMRAMPTNGASASAGSGQVPPWPQGSNLESQNFGNGSPDPCGGAPAAPGHVNEAMPASVVYSRLAVYGANAASTTGWNILCAFQMAYMCYLYLVGPIVAALWVWPIKALRDALPSWIEGVITLCFWSMFWNTTILLMACFKDYGTTGTYIFTALNFLSTSCVKYAFDFAGLVSAAGQAAAQNATQPGQGGSGGAGAGGKKGAGASAGKLPPGAHLLPGMAGGKLHAVDAKGNLLTFDGKTGIWTPDGAGTGGGVGAGGAGGGAAGDSGGSGGGGPNLSSTYAGSVTPVTVNHVPPPLLGSAGTFTTPIPNSNYHLQLSSDGKGGLSGQLVDSSGKLAGSPMPLVSDGQGGFKMDLPNGETLAIKPNATTGGEDALFTQTSTGAVLGQESIGAAGQATLQFAGQNGDMVYVRNIGNGLAAVTVVGASGSVNTFVGRAGEAIGGMANDGAKLNVMTDAGGNPLSISLDHTPGTAGGLETFAVTTGADGSRSIAYTGVDGKVDGYETISAPVASSTGSAVTTAFFDGNHNALGTQTDTVSTSATGILTDRIADFDGSGKQIGQFFEDAKTNQITSGTVMTDGGAAVSFNQVADPSGSSFTWVQTGYAALDSQFNGVGATTDSQVRADGSVENRSYNNGQLVEDKVVAADGTTVVSDAKYSYEANGNVDCSQKTYNADGSYVVTSSVSDANHALVSSTSTSYDASGAVIGHTETQQNQQGGYDVKQYDAKVDASNPNGHLIASETTAAGTGGMVTDTSTSYSYGSDGSLTGKSVDTAVFQNGQSLSDNRQAFVMQSGTWVEQQTSSSGGAQTVSLIGGTNDYVTMSNSSAGSTDFKVSAYGQTEYVSVSSTGQAQAYHIDSSNQKVNDSATYDWTNNTVSVNTGSDSIAIKGDASDGYQVTVGGSTLSGQAQSPETFTFAAPDSGNVVSLGGGNAGWVGYDSSTNTFSAGSSSVSGADFKVQVDGGVNHVTIDGVTRDLNPSQTAPGTVTQFGTAEVSVSTDAYGNATYSVMDHGTTTKYTVPETATKDASSVTMSVNGQPGVIVKHPNVVKQAAPQGLLSGLASKYMPAGVVSRTAPTAVGNGGNSGGNSGGNGGQGNGSSGDQGNGSKNLNNGAGNSDQALFKDVSDDAVQAFSLDDFSNTSLQDQLINAGTHVRNTGTINSVLRKSYGGNTRPEAIVAATVDQNIATIYSGQGKYGQAEELYKNALQVMDRYQDAPEYSVLIETYAAFLDKQGRCAEADSHRAKLCNLPVSALVTW